MTPPATPGGSGARDHHLPVAASHAWRGLDLAAVPGRADVLRDLVVQPGAAREGRHRDQPSVRHVGRQRVVCLLTQLWL